MSIAVIAESHKEYGESARIARYVAGQFENAFVLDLEDDPLPELLAEDMSAWEPWAEKLQACEGVILVTPEYNGMTPPKVRNFLHLCEAEQVGHKPGLIVSVSAGINGAYPVSELRAYGTKNNRLCWMPEHLIVRSAGQMLGEEVSGEHDETLRRRVDWTLDLFRDYVAAFNTIRAKGRHMHPDFTNGM